LLHERQKALLVLITYVGYSTPLPLPKKATLAEANQQFKATSYLLTSLLVLDVVRL
jgi:hypothetical protein